MKPTAITTKALPFFLFALIFSAVCPADARQGAAVVTSVVGAAEYSADGKNWAPVKPDDVLPPGTEIRSHAGAAVDLFLNYNGPLVRVDAQSRVRLTKLEYTEKGDEIVTDTEIDVKEGAILGYTQKLSANSRYVVNTPDGEAEITGTHYKVNADLKVVVVSGSVRVKYKKYGQKEIKVIVNSGQTFDPLTGMVRPTLPTDTAMLIADINTMKKSEKKFSAGKDYVKVKPRKVISK
jgi:ferric-dicitrate binding protein FerR (iron transport regulator)